MKEKKYQICSSIVSVGNNEGIGVGYGDVDLYDSFLPRDINEHLGALCSSSIEGKRVAEPVRSRHHAEGLSPRLAFSFGSVSSLPYILFLLFYFFPILFSLLSSFLFFLLLFCLWLLLWLFVHSGTTSFEVRKQGGLWAVVRYFKALPWYRLDFLYVTEFSVLGGIRN